MSWTPSSNPVLQTVKHPFFPIERCQGNILPTLKFFQNYVKSVKSRYKQTGSLGFFLFGFFFLNNSFLYATTVVSSVNSKPQYSLHFKSFWTEYVLKASTNIRVAILLQVHELSSFEGTVMCVATCSKDTHTMKRTFSFRHISVVFFKEHYSKDLLVDEQSGQLISYSNGVYFQFNKHKHQNQSCTIWRHSSKYQWQRIYGYLHKIL